MKPQGSAPQGLLQCKVSQTKEFYGNLRLAGHLRIEPG